MPTDGSEKGLRNPARALKNERSDSMWLYRDRSERVHPFPIFQKTAKIAHTRKELQ
jgi:hypothetical protein